MTSFLPQEVENQALKEIPWHMRKIPDMVKKV